MTAGKDHTTGMKSAYELALERLEGLGLEPPKEEGLSEALRAQVGEVRTRAKAKLAELEILHRGNLTGVAQPEERAKAEDEYVRDRRRIEERRDSEIERLRKEG